MYEYAVAGDINRTMKKVKSIKYKFIVNTNVFFKSKLILGWL